MSPSIKHFKKNEQTLKWSADLRNLILKKGETKVSSFVELDATQFSNNKSQIKKPKKKAKKKRKAQRSTSNKSIKSTHSIKSAHSSNTKPKPPSKAKNVIISYSQSPKELQRQIESRQSQLTELETEMLYQKTPPEQANEKLERILSLQEQIQKLKTAKVFDEKSSSPKFRSSKKGTLKSLTSVDSSALGTKSPKEGKLTKKSIKSPKNTILSQTSLADKSKEVTRRISRISEKSDQQSDNTPSQKSKLKTPKAKFSELVANQKNNLQVQMVETLGPRDNDENRNMNVYNSPKEYTEFGQGFPSTAMPYVRQDMSPISKANFVETQEDDLKPFAALLDQAKEINAKKSKYFNFLDEAEEIFVNEELDDCKWDQLARKYRQLYYRGREVKKLLYEFADSNTALSKTVEDLIRNRGELNKQISLQRQDVGGVTKDFGRVQTNLVEMSNKFSQQKANFQQRIEDLEYANEALKTQLSEKRNEAEKLQIRIEERDKAVSLLKTQHEQKNDQDKKSLNDETRVKFLLEDRIKGLEQKVEGKEKTILQIQEERIKDHYLRSELEADIDLLQKKLKSTEREYEDVKRENKELIARLNSYNRSFDEMQERVHEQEFNKRGQNEQLDHLKEKIQELKERNKELQDSNYQLNTENARLLLDVKMKDRIEQSANQLRFDNEMSKEKINQQEDDLLRLNRDLVRLDEECRVKSLLVNQLQDEIKKLQVREEELTQIKEKERKQRKKLNEYELKVEQLENEMRRKETKLNDLEHDFKGVESEEIILKRENNQLKGELEPLRREHALALEAVDKLKRVETELRYEVDEIQREKDSLKSKLNVAKYEKEQLKEEKEMLLARDSSKTTKATAQRFQEDRERKTEDAIKNLNGLRGMIDTFRRTRDSQRASHY